MRVLSTPRFDRAVKKLHAEEKGALDEAVRSVIVKPASGEPKKGDLSNVRVYKYRFNRERMLLAYAANEKEQVDHLDRLWDTRKLLSRSRALRSFMSQSTFPIRCTNLAISFASPET